MTTTKNFLIAFIFSFWIILVATFSIQNITLVSLNFFFFQSIEIPVGVLLAMILASGFLIGSILPLFFKSKSKKKKNPRQKIIRETEDESDPIFDW